MKRWTQEEDLYLKNNYPSLGPAVCSDSLNRTSQAVKLRAMRLGIAFKLRRDWTKEEDEILKESYYKEGPARLEDRLVNRTRKAIITRAQTLNLNMDHSAVKRGLEYESKLFDRDLDVFLLGNYEGSHIPIEHTCSMKHKWVATPNQVLSGHYCPYCSGRKTDRNTYENLLKSKNIPYDLVDEYVNVNIKTKHKCDCGTIWSTRPNDVLRGTGCPSCAKYGFDKTKPAILYYIKFSEGASTYYKIGITNRTIRQRFNKTDLNKASILLEEYHSLGSTAFEKEQDILTTFQQHRSYCDFLSTGNTEVFEIDVLGLDSQK